ncbi:chromate transporter [Caminicella sporogenes DSM 14501]|uniref:Chromate transporter n=1 Tax=Caminicella sporogenes DSM 14501 TaxID=1121266 RepID=A0A1M6NZ79_9FIRM|nr:chromate transporter [Caminicella sporogenes]RKD21590.1 chromate transporter [Caminicella sporogenes]WIF94125.1 chromate transporter [Caminicella sporogenes]SHK00958.1 chromate transporter [Caminicella sporogenes DSM 14501]
MKELFKLFGIFFKIGAFTFGGGYAMIPLIEEEIVNKNKWIDEDEFLDIIAVAQSIPGALAVNTSTYIGYKIFGLKGAIISCLGVVLPSFIIILTIAKFLILFLNKGCVEKFFAGVRPAVVSLILVAVFKLKKGIKKSLFSFVIIITTIILILIFKVHPILIIIISGLLGYYFYKGVNVDESNS